MRRASSCAVGLRWSSRDGGSRSSCAGARGACCSRTWCSTATARCAATSSPRRCGRAAARRRPTSRCSRPPLVAPAQGARRRACSRAAASCALNLPPRRRGRLGGRRARASRARAAALDAGDLQAALGGGRARRIEIADRGLLPGLEAPWIDERRGELGDLRVEALEALAAAGAAARRRRLAGGRARRARGGRRPAPFRESARAALMEVLRARGNVAEALRAYEDVARAAARGARHLARARAGRAARAAAARRRPRRSAAPPPPAPQPAAVVDARGARARGRAARRAAAPTRRRARAAPRSSRARPGIGKTRLLAEAAPARGGERRAASLDARAGELEREFPFGVVRQLFEAAIGDPATLTRRRGARRASCSRAPGEAPPGGDALVRRAARAVLGRAEPRRRAPAGARGRRPALVRPPVAALPRLPRAPARGPAGPARRDACAPASRRPTPALLAEIANDPATVHVRPGPLSEEAVGELVARAARRRARRARSARPATARPAATRCSLRQLLTALEADGVRPDAAHADVVRAIGSRAVAQHGAAAARAAAGRGGDGRARDRGARRGRRAARGRRARRRSTRRSVAERDGRAARGPRSCAASRRPAFVHPLVRDAVYHELPPGERELLHARAAARAARRRRAAGPDRRASSCSTPRRGDPWVARAAARGRQRRDARGAADSARRLPAARARGAAAARASAPRLLLELGRVGDADRGPEAAAAPARRPTTRLDGDPDLRVDAANALGRALLFTVLAEGGRRAWRSRPPPRCRRSAPTTGSAWRRSR